MIRIVRGNTRKRIANLITSISEIRTAPRESVTQVSAPLVCPCCGKSSAPGADGFFAFGDQQYCHPCAIRMLDSSLSGG